MRIVLDTNVLLAAFATRGLCEALFALCLEEHSIVLSQHILEEFSRHARGKFKFSAALARDIERLLLDHAEIVTPNPIERSAFKDRDDLPVLGTALAGNAAMIVTGDAALLALSTFREVTIISPRQAYEQLKH